MHRIFGSLVLFVAVVWVIAMGSQSASAQVTAGLASISGIVEDSSGAAIADAQVVVANGANGVHLTLSTSDGGIFNATALAPLTGYTVTVTKAGFAAYQVKDIELPVGQNVNIVVPLSIATATQSIQVIGSAPVVDDTKTDVSQVVGTQQILDLPINGRRVDTFALLTPGVTNDGNFGLLTFRGVANGNTFLLDGNDSTEQFFVENNGRTRITSQISQDAVQEFQVVSANYSAEYGRAMGGVVNTITRSGTDQFHGTGYWFFRNSDMIARDPFTPPSIHSDEWRSQAGASVGGPIVKDKLFFFVNGDFTNHHFPLVDTYNRPLFINSATQTFLPAVPVTSPNGCGAPATPAQCAAISALLPPYFGLIPRTVNQDLAFARIDYHFSDRNTFSVSFNYMNFNSPDGLQQTLVTSTSGAGINGNGNDYGRVRNGKVSWTSIVSPNVVNNFRYGLNTDLEQDTANSNLLTSLGLLNVCVGSSGSCGSGVLFGSANYLPRVEPNETRNEFADDLSWTRGRHSFKFGVDFASTSDFSIFLQNLNGQFNYASATAFALDYSGNTTGAKNWRTFTQSFGNAALTTRINDYDFYVEDQWRVTNKLTATVGLRYEYSQLPKPPLCNPTFPGTCRVNSPDTNLMPRVGLAYRLNDKTVLRAGYGIFYARMAGATLQDLFTAGNGIGVSSISLSSSNATQKAAGPVFPNVLTAAPTGLASTTSIQFAAPNLSAPYSEQASVAVERDAGHGISITVSGIWSRGIHLFSVQDLNMPTGTTPFTYKIEDPAGNVTGSYTTNVLLGQGGVSNARPNPLFGGIYEDGNAVVSFYDGLAVQVQKRFSHGFQASLSYTWSHELDDGQGFGQSTSNLFLSNNFSWLLNNNFRADYGSGEEDQRQRLAFSWIWQPTITHRDGALYKYLVNNWQLSSITTINSARPYGSPNISLSDTPVPGMFSNFSVNGTGLSGRAPFLPVNAVNQPAMYRDDMRLSKILPFGDRYKLYLSLEAFNISNTWSPTSMLTSAYTESGGIIKLNAPGSSGVGSGDSYPPDGTEARRLQVSARFTF